MSAHTLTLLLIGLAIGLAIGWATATLTVRYVVVSIDRGEVSFVAKYRRARRAERARGRLTATAHLQGSGVRYIVAVALFGQGVASVVSDARLRELARGSRS